MEEVSFEVTFVFLKGSQSSMAIGHDWSLMGLSVVLALLGLSLCRRLQRWRYL